MKKLEYENYPKHEIMEEVIKPCHLFEIQLKSYLEEDDNSHKH